MPSLDEILAKGSKSFRQLNAGLNQSVPARTAPRRAPAPRLALAHALPDDQPQSQEGPALERGLPATDGGARIVTPRPHVHFYLHRVRLLDTDNKWASVKPLLDALRHAKLITDDRECDIDLCVTQHRVRKYMEEGTGIEITYW